MEYAQRAGEAGDNVDMGNGDHRTSVAEYWQGRVRTRVGWVEGEHICEVRHCQDLLVCRPKLTPEMVEQDTLPTGCADERLESGVVGQIPSGETDQGRFPVHS